MSGEIIARDIVKDYTEGNSLRISVNPNSSKNEITGYNEAKKSLKVNIAAPPDKGKANKEIIKFFSKLLKKKVNIIKGLKSRDKVLQIS